MKKFRKMASVLLSVLIILTVVLSPCQSFAEELLISPNPNSFAKDTAQTSNADLKVAGTYSGFKLMSIEYMSDIDSNIMIFQHEKTGAKLMFVQNDDNERAFSIAFRTPPSDNTGVNHIIEHSVLNGSKNYPVKSPFAQMLTRSLGSFINAMTAQDYTVYPVSSSNEKDLQNLMSVYLDAVFYPNVLKDKNIFMQEGWRYDLFTSDSPLTVNGVVYNEMKGYYSDPSWILNDAIKNSLFPDSSAKWESGGKPEEIVNLTWEKLVETHKKYYTPSNSYIVLYGNLEILKYLEYIDSNYFSKFEKSYVDTTVQPQVHFTEMQTYEATYPVAIDSDTTRKSYLSLNFVTGTIGQKDDNVGLSFLCYLLAGPANSPLQVALQKNPIADSISCSYSLSSLQPVLSITAQNADPESADKFQKMVMDVLTDISENGFDEDYLSSAFSSYDMSYRVQNLMPMKGLSMAMNATAAWVYDVDPTMYFETASSIAKIKNTDQNKYFRNLINNYLISNTHSSLVVLKPEPTDEVVGLPSQVAEFEKYRKYLSEDTINWMIENTQKFYAWQSKPDTKEALSSLPTLSLDDIAPGMPNLEISHETVNGIDVYSHDVFLNGLSMVSLYFDSSRVPQDKLHYITLLTSLLGTLDTENYNSVELQYEIAKNTGGGLAFTTTTFPGDGTSEYEPKVCLSFITPSENLPQTFELAEEIINNTLFTNKEWIRMVLMQSEAALQQQYATGLGTRASENLSAYMSESGRYMAELSGYSYYKFIKSLNSNFDTMWNVISKSLQEVSDLIFNKNGLIAMYSGSINDTEFFKEELLKMSEKLAVSKLPSETYSFEQPDKNVAYASTAMVQTILLGSNFTSAGYEYSGKMMVLQKILNMDYLWNKVRVSGGAYNVGVSISNDGTIIFQSSSDPNLKETLDIFRGSVDYLRNFDATEAEMENYIIGVLGELQQLSTMGPLYEGDIAFNMYLSGMSEEDLLLLESEVLSTTAEDIRNMADMVEKALENSIYYVEGSKDKIAENSNLFTRTEFAE